MFPTTLLPLAAFQANSHLELHATSAAVQGYVDWITTADRPPAGKTYVPVVRLPHEPRSSEEVLERLEDLSKTTPLFSRNKDAYHYLLAELVDNIYEHARASRAYVMAQYYPRKGLIEVSFMDDGMTIPRSLGHGLGATYPPNRAYQAILDALSGKSSKEGGLRGYGLSSSARLVNGLGGEALIVSARGAVVSTSAGRRLPYALREQNQLDGTLVSFRLPDSERTVNLYALVEE